MRADQLDRDEFPERRPLEAMTFGQLAATVRALDDQAVDPAVDPARADRPGVVPGRRQRVVGVDGMSGSGKSGFARRLAAELGAPVLSVDDLVPGWDALAESVTLLSEGVLRPLAAGRPARWRRYDWIAGRPGEWAGIEPGDFLVVEGCCVGLPPAAACLSYLIWVDATAAERRRRLERRPDWGTYQPFAERWARQEDALQADADTRHRADLVVDNNQRSPDGDWADVFFGAARVERAPRRHTRHRCG
jgi:uridine kinase